MQAILDFISQYLGEVLLTIFGAIGTAIATIVKNKYEEYINAKLEEKIDETKAKVVTECVNAVEQVYKDLTGKEKFIKVVEYVDARLEQKGITISEVEIKMLAESAVYALNQAKKCEDKKETTNEVDLSILEELEDKYTEVNNQ